MGSTDLTSNRPITAVHLNREAGMRHAEESPRWVSEPPRPKESQSREPVCLNSVSTDNPKS